MKNLEKYKKDLDKLIEEGEELLGTLMMESGLEEAGSLKDDEKKNIKRILKDLTWFYKDYQQWYSEALILVKLVLPERANDFIELYKKPQNRENERITRANYVIEDALQGLNIFKNQGTEEKKVVGIEAAIPRMQQQLGIIKSCKRRFESSLFDIKQLLQADLFNSELEEAEELNKKGFVRGAGAVAGVVLEGHLLQVCRNHDVIKNIKAKKPTICDFNQALKKEEVIELSVFRNIEFLGDLRNKCDHKKPEEPTKEEVKNLIDDVKKIIKNVF